MFYFKLPSSGCGYCLVLYVKYLRFSSLSYITLTLEIVYFFLKIFKIYLREKKRAHEQGRGRERGRSRLPAKQGAHHGAQSQDPETMT